MMGNAYETFVYYTSKLLIRHMTSMILFLINATIQSESVSTDINDFLYIHVQNNLFIDAQEKNTRCTSQRISMTSCTVVYLLLLLL